MSVGSGHKIDEFKELQLLSETHKGEVMVHDLAQHMQVFLHRHNKATTGSFYVQMLIGMTSRDEALMSHKNRLHRDEVLKRKKILRNEDRCR